MVDKSTYEQPHLTLSGSGEILSTYQNIPVVKLSNPKDAIGSTTKVPMSYVPVPVMMEVGLGMLEGGAKYGRYNYRAVGVRGSVYYDATLRHMFDWWEGEDYDPDSVAGLHHVTKAIASLTVIRDAMLQGKFIDDRPPSSKRGWMQKLNAKVPLILEQHKDKNPRHYTIEDTDACNTGNI